LYIVRLIYPHTRYLVCLL